MRINADLACRAALALSQYQWTPSPQAGVERVMLDRIGDEPARATSIVRYAPNASFPRHPHPGGEEILVLSGIFSEGEDDYPAGWYLRNPPGSSHQPRSDEGATIFVKLGQMSAQQQQRVRINTGEPASWRRQDGREVCPLFEDAHELVCLIRLAPHQAPLAVAKGGAEMLVLAGELREDTRPHAVGGWLRLPAGAYCDLKAGEHGATIYLKTGHLSAAVVKE
jgi:anti-sigma factor ChrR (cupin superfamily)